LIQKQKEKNNIAVGDDMRSDVFCTEEKIDQMEMTDQKVKK
jgi:hypothetical protein